MSDDDWNILQPFMGIAPPQTFLSGTGAYPGATAIPNILTPFMGYGSATQRGTWFDPSADKMP